MKNRKHTPEQIIRKLAEGEPPVDGVSTGFAVNPRSPCPISDYINPTFSNLLISPAAISHLK